MLSDERHGPDGITLMGAAQLRRKIVSVIARPMPKRSSHPFDVLVDRFAQLCGSAAREAYYSVLDMSA